MLQLLRRVKSSGRRNRYDCLIGLSGGVDSSYVALKAADWGLRPLVIHVDTGWNTELAVANIERVVKYCDFHLHTIVIDWREMRDLQLAYLLAGVANQDVPQDHAIFSATYHFAAKNRIQYIVTGGNNATEGIFPRAWLGDAMDGRNLLAIHAQFGRSELNTYPVINWFDYYLWYPFARGLTTLRPLNFIRYDKEEAIKELINRIGWRPYHRKHGESSFTKFYQNYYLPTRFGIDKRRPHFSSMIVSGQLTREEALDALQEPLYDPAELEQDLHYVCKKLGICRSDFDVLMQAPRRSYHDFQNWGLIQRMLKGIQAVGERVLGRPIRRYS